MPRAIPTLFKVPNPPQPLLGKRQPPKSRSVVTTKKARSTAVGNDVEQPGDNADHASKCTTSASSQDVQLTPRKIELTNKLKLAKKQLAPSPGLFELCNAMERIVQMNIEAVIAGPAVVGSLKDLRSRRVLILTALTYKFVVNSTEFTASRMSSRYSCGFVYITS